MHRKLRVLIDALWSSRVLVFRGHAWYRKPGHSMKTNDHGWMPLSCAFIKCFCIRQCPKVYILTFSCVSIRSRYDTYEQDSSPWVSDWRLLKRTLTLSSPQTTTGTFANSVDPDEFITIYIVWYSDFFNYFKLKPLFTSVDISKFKDCRVYFTNGGERVKYYNIIMIHLPYRNEHLFI